VSLCMSTAPRGYEGYGGGKTSILHLGTIELSGQLGPPAAFNPVPIGQEAVSLDSERKTRKS
jgi:hypothetical protein